MDVYDRQCRTFMRQGKTAASAMKLARVVVGRSKDATKQMTNVLRTKQR